MPTKATALSPSFPSTGSESACTSMGAVSTQATTSTREPRSSAMDLRETARMVMVKVVAKTPARQVSRTHRR